MRELLLLLIIVVSTLTPLELWTLADPQAVVKVGSASLKPGETATIAVRVENIPSNGGLGAYDIKLAFNPSVIQVLDVEGGDPPFNTVTAKNIDNAGGWVRFNHFITATQGPTGSITIARLKVKAIGSPGDSTSLNVQVISLVDARTGEEIPRSTSPGSVSIVKPPPEKKPSYITVAINITKLKIGESVEIQGDIRPDRPGATVTVTFTRPDRSTIACQVKANSTGGYTISFVPDMAGEWRVRASWPGDSEYEGATSSTLTFRVAGKESTIYISVFPVVPEKGETLKIYGSIDPPHANVPVTIYLEWMGVRRKLGTVRTNENGAYLYAFKIELTGEVKFYAEWPGSREYEGARSKSLTLIVKEEIVKKRVVLPTKEEAEIRLVSNSTETEAEVSLEERRITVKVSGPRGAKGVLKLFIPVSLLEAYNSSINRVLFLLDKNPIEPAEIREVETGYLLTLVYSHSTRRIDVYYVTYSISIKVLDYGKKPVERAEVNLTGPVSLTAKTNATGEACFMRVPAGTYRVEVYYGPKVGEGVIEVPKSLSRLILTAVRKWEILYGEARERLKYTEARIRKLEISLEEAKTRIKKLKASLEETKSKYEAVRRELETYKSIAYTLPAVAVTCFIAGYIAGRRRRKGQNSQTSWLRHTKK